MLIWIYVKIFLYIYTIKQKQIEIMKTIVGIFSATVAMHSDNVYVVTIFTIITLVMLYKSVQED